MRVVERENELAEDDRKGWAITKKKKAKAKYVTAGPRSASPERAESQQTHAARREIWRGLEKGQMGRDENKKTRPLRWPKRLQHKGSSYPAKKHSAKAFFGPTPSFIHGNNCSKATSTLPQEAVLKERIYRLRFFVLNKELGKERKKKTTHMEWKRSYLVFCRVDWGDCGFCSSVFLMGKIAKRQIKYRILMARCARGGGC